MNTLVQFIILLLLLNNFALLSSEHMKSRIRLMAVQGFLLALLLLALPVSQELTHTLAVCLAVFGIKGLGFPWLLARTSRRAVRETRIRPLIGYNLSVLAGILALIFSLWLEARLPIAVGFFPFLLFPAAFTTIFTGFVLLVGRVKAISQVIGYLATENGIFLLGLPLMSAAGGFWLEMLILLDVLVAVCVMGIAIKHISSTFESTDVGRFCVLKD